MSDFLVEVKLNLPILHVSIVTSAHIGVHELTMVFNEIRLLLCSPTWPTGPFESLGIG